jgi:penicillin-binding protein 2
MKRSRVDLSLGNNYIFKGRGIFLRIVVIAIFGLLVSRMVYLQIIKNEKYKYMSEKNRVRLRRVEAPRGNIFDATGELLVSNVSGYRLVYLEERKIDEEKAEKIAELTNQTPEFIKKRVKNGEIFPYTRENVLIENLDEKLAHKIMEKLEEYPYLQIQVYSKRKYLNDELASHILGYVKKISKDEYESLKEEGYSPRDIVGKEGVEKIYNKALQGKAGYEYIEVNALNRAQKKIESSSPIPGGDVHLTIDMRLQKYMESIFKEEGYTGSVIALNPKNGEILTIVSYPTYSLNMFSSQISNDEWKKIITDPRRPLNNKAVAGEYPPGSVFKVISAFSFLKKGINPNEKFYDNGYYSIGNWKWKAWKAGGHGYVDMRKSIIESANPYYYKLADQIGHEPIVEMAKSFGIGKKTGIDITGEKSGILPDTQWKRKVLKEGWYKGDTINLSIGQGYLNVTPLQVALAYTILANRGFAYKPHVVKYIDMPEGKELIEKEILHSIKYPKSYYDILNDALVATVNEKNGTTKKLQTPGLEIAAKSGSAQNAHHKETHAWVAGYFPAKDPKIVFVVLLEGAGGGGSVAGAVAKKFIDKYLELYETKQ